MSHFKKSLLAVLLISLAVVAFCLLGPRQKMVANHASEVKSPRTESQQNRRAAASSTNTARAVNYWQMPSENKAYPNVSAHPNLRIEVSLKKQRVYLKDGKATLYTMLASTGKNGGTPTGHFQIQAERGQHFYNQKSNEGANYWVSFKDHGVYLFHTVPVDVNGAYNIAEAQQLGETANSHGCIRLSIADARWFFENIPENTAVHIY